MKMRMSYFQCGHNEDEDEDELEYEELLSEDDDRYFFPFLLFSFLPFFCSLFFAFLSALPFSSRCHFPAVSYSVGTFRTPYTAAGGSSHSSGHSLFASLTSPTVHFRHPACRCSLRRLEFDRTFHGVVS